MGIGFNSNARRASMLICTGSMSEPEFQSAEGIYLGKTSIYGTPFFLNQALLLNPHIAVLGMSGSGKSYFIKSLVSRNVMHGAAHILILDWTGEYNGVTSFLNGSVFSPGAALTSFDDTLLCTVSCIDLSSTRSDADRKKEASQLLAMAIDRMRRSGMCKGTRHLIVLDEAWRFLENSSDVRAMLREGRKYGFGIVTATQLAGDVSREVLSNSACVAVFRLQNAADCRLLLETGILNSSEKSRILQLPQGSCMLALAENTGEFSSRFFIRRVDGVDMRVFHMMSGSMHISMSGSEFQKITERSFPDSGTRQKIEGYASGHDLELDVSTFIRFLISNGLSRAEILSYLRALGMRDIEMVEAYEGVQQ